MVTEKLIEYANAKFQSFKPGRWNLHSWDFGGSDYGFELILIGKDWKFVTMTESQYGPSTTILITQDERIIWQLIECFEPTNQNYKTQRK